MKTIIKLIIACLLLICLLKMPYGFYQFVRIVTFIGCCIIAYQEYKEANIGTSIISGLIAVLFNPILIIYFPRIIWHGIDLLVGTYILIWAIIDFKNFKKEKLRCGPDNIRQCNAINLNTYAF